MPYRKLRVHKEFELVSLIDVVFLLIIFGLTISLYRYSREEGEQYLPRRLNIEVNRMPAAEDELIGRLQVAVHGSDTTGRPYIELFPPDYEWANPDFSSEAFSDLPACQMISERIVYFADTLLSRPAGGTEFADHVFVDVVGDAPSRVVNHVMTELAPYRGRLPWVKLETH
jgi:hypothetical protein